jgi:hypothetical protein
MNTKMTLPCSVWTKDLTCIVTLLVTLQLKERIPGYKKKGNLTCIVTHETYYIARTPIEKGFSLKKTPSNFKYRILGQLFFSQRILTLYN